MTFLVLFDTFLANNTTMFNLYVGSPAFALPSLDAECIAAIAYLKELFHDRAEQWTVVEAHDPSTSPTGQ